MKTKLAERPVLYCFIVTLFPALLCAVLAIAGSWVTSAPLFLAISYLCRFLNLLVGFLGLGCALRAANRAKPALASAYLAVASAAYAITQGVVTVPEILYINSMYPDDLPYTIFTNVGAALGNALIFFLLFFVIFAIVYLVFFRGKKPMKGELPFFSRRDRRTLAAALATALLFLYQFIPQLLDTLSIIMDKFGPAFTQADLLYTLLNSAFLILSMLLGYMTLGIVQGYEKE